jgi:hypothetical protein
MINDSFAQPTAPVEIIAEPGDLVAVEFAAQGPPGLQGDQGDKGAQGVQGAIGIQGPVGATGPLGLTGPQGIPGNTVLYGTSNPVSTVGVDGNFYINTTTLYWFGPRASGVWPPGISLIGPLPEAPNDTNFYGRQFVSSAMAWAVVVATSLPAGTVMLFYQTAAPTGWTKLTTQDDKALRVTQGATGGSAGGTNAFSTVMAQTVVGNNTLSSAAMATHNHVTTENPHNHTINAPNNTGSAVVTGAEFAGNTTTTMGSNTTALTLQNSSGGGGVHNHTITMAIAYVDLIMASKN